MAFSDLDYSLRVVYMKRKCE